MKIGILTHYYKSLNYGGVLQAYALAAFLRKQGYEAEQISFRFSSEPFARKSAPRVSSPRPSGVRGKLSRYKNALRYRLVEKPREEAYARYKRTELAARAEAFSPFCEMVPHSADVFTPETVLDAAAAYDCLITGSDQVWNFDWFNPAFFLDLPGCGAKRIAYAASAGRSDFDEAETAYLRWVLPGLQAISVRESDLAAALNELLETDRIVQTVDPTLLLTAGDWEALASPRRLSHKYLFCYFLHNNAELVRLAKRFARRHHLTIAMIPFPGIEYNEADVHFGRHRFDAASPADFLSLIRHADYVLTDSFHATVFSLLFEKRFATFPRSDALRMSSRLRTLTELFGCPERFCGVPEEKRFQWLNNLPDRPVQASPERVLSEVGASIRFLSFALGKE